MENKFRPTKFTESQWKQICEYNENMWLSKKPVIHGQPYKIGKTQFTFPEITESNYVVL